jgi:hypothetical protein
MGLRIKFPFEVKQTGKNVVDVLMLAGSPPLFEVIPGEAISDCITDADLDEINNKVGLMLIKASIKIEY